jgi:hypothetical protein
MRFAPENGPPWIISKFLSADFALRFRMATSLLPEIDKVLGGHWEQPARYYFGIPALVGEKGKRGANAEILWKNFVMEDLRRSGAPVQPFSHGTKTREIIRECLLFGFRLGYRSRRRRRRLYGSTIIGAAVELLGRIDEAFRILHQLLLHIRV